MRTERITKTIVIALGLLFISTALIPTIQAQFTESLDAPTWQPQRFNGPLTPLVASTLRPPHDDRPAPLSNPPLVLHLPTTQVTLVLHLALAQSYLNTSLSNVPTGYDVISHWYYGWCGDYYHYININTAYQVTLYSSYDPALPTYLYHANWSKVNYILNHKVGTDYRQIQDAIWYILDCGNQGLNTDGWAMVNAARTNGATYIPAVGQICAVIVGVNPTVQRTIFEATVPARTLTLACDGQGSIAKDPDLAGYVYGQVVNLTAQPTEGWSFDHWTGDATGTANPVSLTMNADKTATAHFTQNQYTLTTSTEGSGAVAKDPDQTTYTYGQIVHLTGQPALGWSFDHWTGDVIGSTNPTDVTITGDKAVTASFTQNQYTLTTSMDGSGSIAIDPEQITYTYGQIVHLTAQPAAGWSFDHWTGDVVGSTSPVDITVTDDMAVSAHFTQNQYTLTVTTDGSGSVTKDPEQGTYLYDQVVQLSASADPGWTFDHWTGDATGSTSPVSITITDNKAATAHFTQDQYTLSVSTDGSGTILVDPQQTTYTYGQVVHLTAQADLGWTFDHWTDGATGTTNPAEIIMAGNTAVTAHFTQNHYTLAVTLDGSGSVLKNPDQPTYTYGQTVQLTAQPDLGWSFDHWSGDANGNALSVDITITDNAAISAHFTQNHYTLTTSTDGSGSVSKDPDQTTYLYGQVVHLTAQANIGWTFSHWTGDATGSASPVDVTMTGNMAVTAHFTQNQYTLTTSMDGSGTVSRDPDQPTYTYGQAVSLTASASQGWTFSYWSGDATGSANPVQVTITGNTAVTAHFTQNQYTLTTSTDGSGSVTRDPDQNTYTYGQTVTLTAVPEVGWSFDHWSGDATGTANPVSITIVGNTAVTAHFTQNQYILTISTDGSGSVAKDPDQNTYTYGQVVGLTAVPGQGWSFEHWSGDATGSDNPIEITMDGDKAVTAHFTQNQYTISIDVDGSGTVVKDPDQPTYTYGQTVQLTAQPATDWLFDHWSGDATGSANPVTITITKDAAVTAHFTAKDLIAPSVKIVQPTDAVYMFDRLMCPFTMPLFFHNLTVIVNATDNQSGIDRVEIFVDNVSRVVLTTQPYRWVWTETKPMKHTLTAVASDKAGNRASDSMMVWRWRFHPVIIAYFLVKAFMWNKYNGSHPGETVSTEPTVSS